MSAGDSLPAQVCHQCFQQVNSSYNFKLQCESSDIALRQYLRDLHHQSDSYQVISSGNVIDSASLAVGTCIPQTVDTFAMCMNFNKVFPELPVSLPDRYVFCLTLMAFIEVQLCGMQSNGIVQNFEHRINLYSCVP
jgi:hypothetical protein